MKIKCPSCQTLLQVPDTAAGKVIKCTCGKQMRLPAASAPKASAAYTVSASPVTRPVANAAGTALDASAFDELTTNDMKPIRGVSAVKSTSSSGSSNQPSGMERKPKRTGAIVCLVFAGLFLVSGTGVIVSKVRPNPDAEAGEVRQANLVGYAVGAMLPSVLLLALGIYLWKRGSRTAVIGA